MSSIQVKNLVKHFKKTKALRGISFTVQKGEIFGYLGENGAGKTTTISCMMDFLRPTYGHITLLGLDAQKNAVRLKKTIGYLSDTISLYNRWTGQEHINFFNKLNHSAVGADKVADSEPNNLIKRLEFDSSKKAGQLSTGNRQKLGLILALLNNPKILILDEPTNGLDPVMQNIFYDIIKERANRGTTVFLSSHNLAEIEKVASRVAIIKAGRLVALESIASLKQKRLYQINIALDKPITNQDLERGQLKIQKKTKNVYRLIVYGNIKSALNIINKYQINNLEIKRGSLEKIFMEHYGEKIQDNII